MSVKQESENGIGKWNKKFGSSSFKKWGYENSPYRVVVVKKRGHWTALFTSAYGPESYTISGNNGGDMTGKIKAKQEAEEWMNRNAYGCPPPTEYNE